jgi:hypothetical protein
VNLENQNELSKELRNFINSWRQSWESINTEKYLCFYSSAFVNSEGMDYHAFARHKEKINKTKKFVMAKKKIPWRRIRLEFSREESSQRETMGTSGEFFLTKGIN